MMPCGRLPPKAWPLLLAALAAGAAPALRVVDRPIRFSAKRLEATRRYMKRHYGVDSRDGRIAPRAVVLHWTGLETLAASFKALDAETLPAARADIAGGGDLNVSAHFLVDRDGAVFRLMPETLMARHVIGLNLAAVGVENVGGADDKEDLTPAQVEADARLVRDLKARFPAVDTLIGHYEYRRLEGGPLWKEKEAGYRTAKSDPGPRFMAAVRAKLADLHLKGAP